MNFKMCPRSKKLGGIYLLISQMLERIVFYSIAANFVYTLNSKPLLWTKTNALSATFLHSGFCFVSTMFGGILADTLTKKSTTVIIGYIFYFAYVGYIIVFFPNKDIELNSEVFHLCHKKNNSDSVDMFQETCSSIIIPVTFLCAIGSGMIKSVAASLGSDMALKNWDNPSVFFNIYYWSLNIGSLVSFSIVTFVQQNCSKFYGFLIPGALQILSFVFFLLGLPYYIDVPKSSRSTLNLVFHIYYEAFQKKFNSKYHNITKNIDSITRKDENENIQGNSSQKINNTFDQKQADYPSLSATFIESSNESSDETSTLVETTVSESMNNRSFLDRSKIRFGGNFSEDDVENVRKFSTTLIILIFLIPYWILYFQMETTYFYQALHLDLGFFKAPEHSVNYSIPASWLSMIDIVVLMILLPLLVKCIYPYLRNKGLYPGNSVRIIFGMILAIISVSIAAVVENKINKEGNNTFFQNIGGTNYSSTHISVFIQVPQYLLMGISESQTIIAGLELACTRVPTSMQGVTNGLFWFFSGIGSFLGTALLISFNVSENKYNQDNHSPLYFCVLVALQLFFLLFFLPCIYNIKRKQKIHAITVTSSVVR